MSLPSNYLDAFMAVAKERSFSEAAKRLHLTQSALSQRVQNLELELGSTVFIRESSGIRLTELGERLLRYCQSKQLLEDEFLSSLQSKNKNSLSGIVRIASFSTISRSIVLPIMAELVKQNPQVRFEIQNKELRDLPKLLSSGGTDFILATQPMEKQGIENHLVGHEENVMVKGTGKNISEDIYLDHDEEDSTTHDFFKAQNKKIPSYERSYLDEIYSILDGVRLGMGKAVVPLHLANSSKGIEIVSGHKSLKTPVYLIYYSQPFYTELQKEVIRTFLTKLPEALS